MKWLHALLPICPIFKFWIVIPVLHISVQFRGHQTIGQKIGGKSLSWLVIPNSKIWRKNFSVIPNPTFLRAACFKVQLHLLILLETPVLVIRWRLPGTDRNVYSIGSGGCKMRPASMLFLQRPGKSAELVFQLRFTQHTEIDFFGKGSQSTKSGIIMWAKMNLYRNCNVGKEMQYMLYAIWVHCAIWLSTITKKRTRLGRKYSKDMFSIKFRNKGWERTIWSWSKTFITKSYHQIKFVTRY